MARDLDLRGKVSVSGATEAADALKDVAEAANKVDGVEAKAKVSADTAAADAGLEEVTSEVAALDGTAASVNVAADTAAADAGLDEVAGEVAALEGEAATVNVDADTAAADAGLDEVTAEVHEIEGETATVTVDADTEGAAAGLDEVAAGVDALEGETATVTTEADTESAVSALDGLEASLQALAAESTVINVATNVGSAVSSFGSLKEAAAGAFSFISSNGPLAGAAAAAGIAGFAANAVGDFQELALAAGRFSDATGVATEDASKFIEIAGDLGISADTMEKAISVMNRTLGNSPEKFAALGVEIAHLKDGSVDVTATFANVAEAISNIADPAARAAAAQQLLGRSWQQMSELIMQGGAGIREALAGIELGKIMGPDDTAKAREFRDNLDRIKGIFESFKISAGEGVVDWLNDAADAAGSLKDKVEPVVDVFMSVKDALEGIPVVGDLVGGIIKQFINPIGALGDKIEWLEDKYDAVHDKIFGEGADDIDVSVSPELQARLEAQAEAADADKVAQQELARAAEEAAEAQAELEASLSATNEALDESAIAAEGFSTAMETLNRASELDFADMAFDTVNAFDDVKAALEGAQKAGVDWSTVDLTPESVEELKGISPELQKVTESIKGMRDSIQAELTAAFDTGGIQGFRDKAAFFAAEIGGQFKQAFMDAGASADEADAMVRQLLEALGLLPQQVEIQVKLSQAEAARKTLEIFKSDIDKLPPEVSTEIKTLWAQGSTVEALQKLNDYMVANGLDPIDIESIINPPPPLDPSAIPIAEAVVIPTTADTGEAVALIHNVESGNYGAIITADANTGAATTAINAVESANYGAIIDTTANTGAATTSIHSVEAGNYGAIVNTTATTGAATTAIHNVEAGNYGAIINATAHTSAAESDLNRAARDRVATITARVVGGLFDGGGTVPRPGGFAGEAGPEFIRLPDGRQLLLTGPTPVPAGTEVTSTRRTRQILSRSRRPRMYANGTGGTGPGAVNVAVNLDGRPIAALVARTTAPAIRAAAMTIRAGRA